LNTRWITLDELRHLYPEPPMTTIPLEPVESSMLQSVGYDAGTRTLRVKFKDGAMWDYADVDEPTFRKLHAAPSIGGYFIAHIRAKFQGRRVDDEPPQDPPAPTVPPDYSIEQ
jgi:hypothetical protein